MTSTDTRAAVAAEVRAAMARNKVTQQQLADSIGISRMSLSARLNGVRAFTSDDLFAIAYALDVPVADLMVRAA